MTSKFVVNCKKWPYDVYIGRPSLGIRQDIPGSDGRWGNPFVVGVFIVVMLLIGLATTISSPAIAKKSGGKSLSQVPSTTTDFPGNDQSVVEVHVTSAKKDIIGAYHVRGEIKNLSNDTLQFVKVTAHLYDASGHMTVIGHIVNYSLAKMNMTMSRENKQILDSAKND